MGAIYIFSPMPYDLMSNMETTNGSQTYCTDCQSTTPCSGGGGGAIAFFMNNVWLCGNNPPDKLPDPDYGTNEYL